MPKRPLDDVEANHPPLAPRHKTDLVYHGDHRVDDWYWLRERDNPEVLKYLELENKYTDSSLAHLLPLREQLFSEFVNRVQETDCSAPIRWGKWDYYTRTIAGMEYSIHCRRPASLSDGIKINSSTGTISDEEIVLDENVEAATNDFFELRGYSISPDHSLLAFSTDTTGGERAKLQFRSLDSKASPVDTIDDTYDGITWCNDNATVLFVRADHAMRPYQVWRHTLGDLTDTLIYQENDERFGVGLQRTKTGKFIIIASESRTTSECHLFNADDTSMPAQVVSARIEGVEYSVDHYSYQPANELEGYEKLFIVTNYSGADNFALMECSLDATTAENWQLVIPNRADERLDAIDIFSNYLVLSERSKGLEQIRIMNLSDKSISTVQFPDQVYSTGLGANLDYESQAIRIYYTSLAVPMTDVDVDCQTLAPTTVKVQAVVDHDPSRYETQRLYAPAADGVMIPVSLVRPRNSPVGHPAPLVLYGYGAYEISIDPMFSATRLSLLERGFTYAVAHVRGGGEMGRGWYEDGKMSRKNNTFSDFIAVADFLCSKGFTTPSQLVARGGSAGGLLIGAVSNARPDLFAGLVAEVPFVDCLTTMLDESLPLTIPEWEEWGDPLHDPEAYATIGAYSPYDNVKTQAYPPMLITAGLNDPRVAYWEPAKWVAKLRVAASNSQNIYLRTELEAGHHGPSGRYEGWKEEAHTMAFILSCLEVNPSAKAEKRNE